MAFGTPSLPFPTTPESVVRSYPPSAWVPLWHDTHYCWRIGQISPLNVIGDDVGRDGLTTPSLRSLHPQPPSSRAPKLRMVNAVQARVCCPFLLFTAMTRPAKSSASRRTLQHMAIEADRIRIVVEISEAYLRLITEAMRLDIVPHALEPIHVA